MGRDESQEALEVGYDNGGESEEGGCGGESEEGV
jgi:hypothetical protein